MSSIPIKDANSVTRKVDTFVRTEGADQVETQAVAVVSPGAGTPIDFATQTTLEALLAATNALKDATEALNAKAVALNTDSVVVNNMVERGLTDAQLRSNPLTVEDGAVSAHMFALNQKGTETVDRLTTLADLQNSILALNETMTYLLGAMLEKMPRLDSADRLVTRMVVNGENDISSPYAGIAVNSVGNPSTGAQFMRTFEPWNFSDAGAARIYQQIQVTA